MKCDLSTFSASKLKMEWIRANIQIKMPHNITCKNSWLAFLHFHPMNHLSTWQYIKLLDHYIYIFGIGLTWNGPDRTGQNGPTMDGSSLPNKPYNPSCKYILHFKRITNEWIPLVRLNWNKSGTTIISLDTNLVLFYNKKYI